MKTEPTKVVPGDDLHLTLLMTPHSLNLVTGDDRQHLLAFGRAAFAAGQKSEADQAQRQAEPQAKADIIKDLLHSAHTDGYTSEQQAFIRAIADRVDWLDAPPPARVRPLTEVQLYDWWRSENGLEDCTMSTLRDFTKVVRAVERARGIASPE